MYCSEEGETPTDESAEVLLQVVLSPPGLEPTVAALAGSPAPRCRWAYLLRPFATPGAQALNNSWPESSVPGPLLRLLPGVPIWFLSTLWTVRQVYPSGGYRFTVCGPGVNHLVGVTFVVCAPGVPSCWCQIHGLCTRCNPP